MSRGRAALGALIAGTALAGQVRAVEVEVLRQTGPADKRFNIAVLGDGYRAVDQTLLSQNARAIIDYVFGVSPLKEYEQLFNVKLVHVISNENGADNGSYGAVRDTALGAYFNCDGIDRLLCIDDAKTQLAAAQNVPEYNFAIVLVNDPKYGGSGGPACVSSSNEQSFEVLAHEIGHSLALLADEYSYEGNQPACSAELDCPEPNVTLRTQRDQIKWRAWIDTSTPLPTPATPPFLDVTGLFEGARYASAGVYRSRQQCKMRDLGAPYCAVCTEQFVRSFWSAENVQMIESAEPPDSALLVDDCEPLALAITSPPIVPSTYAYTWSVDGVTLTDKTASASVLPARLGPGSHEVVVTIQDATTQVRSDPNGLLRDRFTWNVSVTRDDCGPSRGGSGGGGHGASGDAGAMSAGAAGVGEGGGTAGDAATAGSAATDTGGVAGDISGGGAQSAAGTTAGASAGSSSAGGAERGDERGSAAPPPRDIAGCGCAVPGRGDADALKLLGLSGVAALLRKRRRLKPR